LEIGRETIETSELKNGTELDLVTHDLKKFFLLLLKKNGYVLEQLYSPLIVKTTPEHQELQAIAQTCITRYHYHHYLGFAQTQWRLFVKEKQVKPLLYVYRVLLTGIHIMRTGKIEANLVNLLTQFEEFKLAHISDLIALKLTGHEKITLPATTTTLECHQQQCDRLKSELIAASDLNTLPEYPSGQAALHDLLLRLRLRTLSI